MLKTIVEFSLRFRAIVIILACVLVAYGIYTAKNAKLDVFPDFVPPEATVQTEAPGFSPTQVEQLVTRPIEQAINGMGNLDSIRSDSIQGLGVVTVVFKEGTDIHLARQNLTERLAELAGEMPAGVKTPRVEPLTSSTMDLLKIGLTSDKPPEEMRAFADFTLKPRILSVPGVATCSVFGGEVRELQIQVIPSQLQMYGLSVQDVMRAATDSLGVRGAGFVETDNQRIAIQSESPSVTAAVLGEVVVATEGDHSVRLKDVAKVQEDNKAKTGDAVIDGQPGVLLTMLSQYGSNTEDDTLRLEKVLEDMTEPDPAGGAFRTFKGEAGEGIEYHPGLHRPATFIKSSLNNIEHSLRLGGILVAIILFVFLFNVRTSIISLTAIPLSLLTAIIVMDKLGYTLNTITLGGLAIAIGEVVDDAIIDIENIYRRLRENRLRADPRPLLRVVLDASLEVRSAVVYASCVEVCVFIPVLTMPGLQGKFFAPLGIAYILAILASLVVALTVTPALSLVFFSKGARTAHDPWLQRMFKDIYRGVLSPLMRHTAGMVTLVAVMCVVVIASFFFFSPKLIPKFREGHFVIGFNMAPGTSITEMHRMGERLSKELLANPQAHVATVEQQIGRAELGEDIFGPENSELHVNLKENIPAKDQQEAEDTIGKILANYPGVQTDMATFLEDRIHESVTGEKAPIVITLFGDDLDDLDDAAGTVSDALRATLKSLHADGDITIHSPPKGPLLVVRLKPERLRQFNYRAMDVLDAVQIAYEGEVVGQQFEGNKVSDVTVILEPSARRTPEQIGGLNVQNEQGLRLPLSELADVYQDVDRSMISHEATLRRQVVDCTPDETVDAASFQDLAKARIAKLELPDTVQPPVFSGDVEQALQTRNDLALHSGVAIVAILVLLGIFFGNARNLVLLLVNLPFALFGGILAVAIVGHDFKFDGFMAFILDPRTALHLGNLTIGEMVGFVTLFGITTRNSIMMISHFEHLVKIDGLPWNRETALRAASERLIPIMMTALVTAFGLLPLALGSGEAGREIEGPMAIVILGGLVSSSLLNLLVLPTLALRFARFTHPAPA